MQKLRNGVVDLLYVEHFKCTHLVVILLLEICELSMTCSGCIYKVFSKSCLLQSKFFEKLRFTKQNACYSFCINVMHMYDVGSA